MSLSDRKPPMDIANIEHDALGHDIGYKKTLLHGTTVAGDVIPLKVADSGFLNYFHHIDFDTNYTPDSEPEGRVWWNNVEKTLNIATGLGPVLQTGYEDWILVYNDTGADMYNGQPVYPVGQVGGIASVALANASTHEKIQTGIAVLTMDVPAGTTGIATQRGDVRGFDTSHLVAGAPVYIGLTDGTLTSTRPAFPNYPILVGGTTISDNTDGAISVQQEGTFTDTIDNFWNGCFRESFDFRVTATGGVITGTLTPANGHPDMTMMFSDGFTMLDTDPGATITLTAGTDELPVENFVYIPINTKVLTVSTSEFPVTEHIRVAKLYLRSANTTETEGAFKNQNINNEVQDTTSNIGHLQHMGDRIRALVAEWDSGTEGSLTVSGSPDDVFVSITSGKVYQMHKQTMPALDMATGDDVHIVNDPNTAYRTTGNLNTLTVDSEDSTLNNRWFSIVVWGVCNKSGEASHIMCNLPSGSYTSEAGAVSDSLGYSNYTIPKTFKGTGFLIARFTLRKSSTNFTYNESVGYQDLRGFVPNTSAGSGAGSSGITTFLGLTDTPSSYSGETLKIPQVNAGETALEFTDSPVFDALTSTSHSTTSLTVDSLTGNSGVYTDVSKQLTSTPPTTGVVGYWSRSGADITPATSGDQISTVGDIVISSDTSGLILGDSQDTTITSNNFGANIDTRLSVGTITSDKSHSIKAYMARGLDTFELFRSFYGRVAALGFPTASGVAVGQFEYDGPSVSASALQGIRGVYVDLDINHTGGTHNYVYGYHAKMDLLGGTGTVINARGFYIDWNADGSETITTATGLWIDNIDNATTTYGIVVDSNTVGLTLGTGQEATMLGSSSGFDFLTNDLTTTGDILVNADNASILVGASGDLDIHHDGTNSVIDNNTGELQLSDTATPRIRMDGTGLAFFNTAPIAKPTVTGAKGGNAALTSLLTQLVNLGLIVDSTT